MTKDPVAPANPAVATPRTHCHFGVGVGRERSVVGEEGRGHACVVRRARACVYGRPRVVWIDLICPRRPSAVQRAGTKGVRRRQGGESVSAVGGRETTAGKEEYEVRERVKRESGKLIPRDVTVRMFDISSV